MKFNDFLKLASRPRKRKNRVLMLAVAKRLRGLRHEKHYNQATYVTVNTCGTACCIAGWVALEAGCPTASLPTLESETHEDFVDDDDIYYLDVGNAAANLLGIDFDERTVLFTGSPKDEWPEPFASRYKAARGRNAKERPSRVAADLLTAVASGKVKLV